MNDNLEPFSTHRVVEQPNPASYALPLSQKQLGDFSHPFSGQEPRSMEYENAGNRIQTASENAPTQLYFDMNENHVEEIHLHQLWYEDPDPI